MDLVKEAQKKRLSSIKKKKALHGWFVDGYCGTNKYYSQFDKKEGYVIVSTVTKHKVSPFPPHFNITYVGLIDEYKGDVKRFDTCDNSLLYSLYEVTHNGTHDF